MARIRKPAILFLLVAFVLALAACSGKTTVKSDLRIKGAPKWVNKGTHYLKDKRGRLFYGVGSASPMGDMSLQRDAADNRARAELARVLSSYMEVMSKDYMASRAAQGTKPNEPGGASRIQLNEQDVSRQIKNLTKMNLTGVKVIGRWRDKRTNIIYSIVQLDMKRVKKTLQQVQGMNEELKRYISTNGDNIFDSASTTYQ